MMRVVVLAAFFVAASAAAQQMYRWTDQNGRVHITDTPPPASAKNVRKSSTSAAPQADAQTPFDVALAMKDYPVSLYTSPVCKEACQKARDHLNRRGIPFKEVQVWNVETAEELKRVSGGDQVPVMLVGNSVQKGFESIAYDELLDSARYPKAGAVKPRAQGAPAAPEGYEPPTDTAPLQAEPVKPPEKPRGPYAPR